MLRSKKKKSSILRHKSSCCVLRADSVPSRIYNRHFTGVIQSSKPLRGSSNDPNFTDEDSEPLGIKGWAPCHTTVTAETVA